MLLPKRVKYRRVQRGRMTGKAMRGNKVNQGQYGLMALEPAWITSNQIEAARVAMTRYIKRGGKVWIKIFPDKPVTEKPAGTRMGSGKGSPEYLSIKYSHPLWLAEYLVGKGVEAIDDLYAPYDIVEDVDAVTTATMKSGKLISALWDGLNRRPYKIVDTTKLPEAQPYDDGVYRGVYMEDGGEEVAVEFTIQDNCFTQIVYRTLQYKGDDYLSEDASQAHRLVASQFQQLIDYLVGKPIASVNDLYQPGQIAQDTDVSTGATLRAPKVISAIWDGLNRHAYRITR